MKRVLGAVLVAAVFAIPRAASADELEQVRYWTQECGPGTLGCISNRVRLEYDPGPPDGLGFGRTVMTWTVTNRQGTGPFADTEPYRASAFWSLSDLDWDFGVDSYLLDGVGAFRVTSNGNAGEVSESAMDNVIRFSGEQSFLWERFLVRDYAGGPARLFVNETVFGSGGGRGSVFGCDDPIVPPTNSWLRTCEGSLTFSASLAGRVSFTERTTVVPEPGTYLLMLTGLFGLGLVAYRRREETLA